MQTIIAVLLLSIAAWLHAAGDVEAGHAKALVCAACHGTEGVSSVSIFPHLAGQHAPYLVKQLSDYQLDTVRHAAVMMPFVANLSEQDKLDLAAYYASLPPYQPRAERRHNPRGRKIYRQGDAAKQITACIACHGPRGQGNGAAGFPLVAGQSADYARAQLQAFQHKTRANDVHAIMRTISAHLDAEDISALADYMASLH